MLNKRLILVLGLLLTVSGVFSWPGGQVRAVPNASLLVINEIYAPNTTYASQYFELYNGTTSTVDLASYAIYNSGSFDNLNGLPNTFLGPGQYMTIAGNQIGGTIGSGLNPTSDFLALVQRGPQDVTIDVANWGRVDPSWPNYNRFQQFFWVSGAPIMPTDTTKSLQRYPNGYDTDQPTDFVVLNTTPSQPPPSYTPTPTAPPASPTSTNTPIAVSTTPTPTAFCGDSYEPDNIPQQGKVLVLNTEQVHSICPAADEDWFKISVTTNKVYALYTEELGGGLDTILAVYQFNGQDYIKINENDDTTSCLCSRLEMTFPTAGEYYVRVRDNRRQGGLGWVYTVGFSANPGPAPTITVTSTSTPDPLVPTATIISGPCSDPYEPDGVPASARLLLIGEVQPGHNFCPAADADWYRFFGGRGKAYTVQTFNLGIGVDTYLYVFDSDGTTVMAQNDDAPAPTSPNPNDVVASSLDFFPIRDDFYYIMVKNKGDLGSPTMSYNVNFRVRANVPPPAGTASPVIAPVVTVTAPVPPTAPPPPTEPPIPTNVPPTPTITLTPPRVPPVETGVPPTLPPEPVPPTEPPVSTETPAIEPPPGPLPTPTPDFVPLPPTGAQLVAMPMQVYVDRNTNNKFDSGEGVYGLQVIFTNDDGKDLAVKTGKMGLLSALLPLDSRARVSIPYLRWSGSVQVTSRGNMIRLPRIALPTYIP